jgi:hypothetical protein
MLEDRQNTCNFTKQYTWACYCGELSEPWQLTFLCGELSAPWQLTFLCGELSAPWGLSKSFKAPVTFKKRKQQSFSEQNVEKPRWFSYVLISAASFQILTYFN